MENEPYMQSITIWMTPTQRVVRDNACKKVTPFTQCDPLGWFHRGPGKERYVQ